MKAYTHSVTMIKRGKDSLYQWSMNRTRRLFCVEPEYSAMNLRCRLDIMPRIVT